MGNSVSGLSKYIKNDVYNFKQGELGNCGMVSSMSTLAYSNKDLYNKVVPIDQNFDSNNSSEVVFNLYKLGKLYEIEVNKTLPTKNNSLVHCRSSNDNLVGPLLEKALVYLHFDGNYESAEGVPASFVMSSLTNNFFEEFYFLANENYHDVIKLISHGLETKSQMVVAFPDKQALKLNLETDHYYSLLNVEKYENNFIKLYDPHGEIVSIRENGFVDTRKMFEICYCENKIFGIPEIKTLIELKDSWPLLRNSNKKTHFVDYDLLIKEDETKILINLNVKKFSNEVKPIILIVNKSKEMEVVNKSFSLHKLDDTNTIFQRYSLRENLNCGQYKIRVYISNYKINVESCEECRKYLENGGNEFLFRLAASKQCSVEKSVKNESDKI